MAKTTEPLRVDKSTGCWLLNRAPGAHGYVFLNRDGKKIGAHRWMYEQVIGPIPDGLELDHLCRNPPCCNPAHLEPVTHLENVRRGAVSGKTHCVNGHEFTPENTYTRPDRTTRDCKACRNEREKRRQSAQRRLANKPVRGSSARVDTTQGGARSCTS